MKILVIDEPTLNVNKLVEHLKRFGDHSDLSELVPTPNTASPKLPADIVEGFHALLARHRSNMWSSEQHIMDQVARFISR